MLICINYQHKNTDISLISIHPFQPYTHFLFLNIIHCLITTYSVCTMHLEQCIDIHKSSMLVYIDILTENTNIYGITIHHFQPYTHFIVFKHYSFFQYYSTNNNTSSHLQSTYKKKRTHTLFYLQSLDFFRPLESKNFPLERWPFDNPVPTEINLPTASSQRKWITQKRRISLRHGTVMPAAKERHLVPAKVGWCFPARKSGIQKPITSRL